MKRKNVAGTSVKDGVWSTI